MYTLYILENKSSITLSILVWQWQSIAPFKSVFSGLSNIQCLTLTFKDININNMITRMQIGRSSIMTDSTDLRTRVNRGQRNANGLFGPVKQ